MAGSAEEESESLDYEEEHGDRNSDDDFDGDEGEEDDESLLSQPSTSEYEPSSQECEARREDPYPSTKVKLEILAYWRNVQTGKKKKRKWSSVVKAYRKLSLFSESLLYRWEKIYTTEAAARQREKMQSINRTVRTRFESARDHGIPVHEVDLRVWAMEANDAQGEQRIASFKASRGWLSNFKRTNRIGIRKITRVVSRVNLENASDKLAAAAAFVQGIRAKVGCPFAPESIFNSDQSGFEKEFHRHQTLEFVGTQQVVGVVQSVTSTTHSYTIQPTISMDGRLIKPLLLILQEKDGKIGPLVKQTMFSSPELHVVASSSGKITKEIVKEWFTSVFLSTAPSSSLLLLDSLSTYKTIVEASQGVKHCSIEIIPASTTGVIQPTDVYFFRHYKSFFRRISDHVIAARIEMQVFQRNSILKIQALVHCQFRSPRFSSFIQYAWFKAGYAAEGPAHETPLQFCFPKAVTVCSHCSRYSLLRCGWCKLPLCFDHLLIADVHLCENFIP